METEIKKGWMIFCDTILSGVLPLGRVSEEGQPDKWDVYHTEREAQLEIIDDLEEYIRQFKAGERGYEEIANDAFVLAVDLYPDGSILTETSNYYPAP